LLKVKNVEFKTKKIALMNSSLEILHSSEMKFQRLEIESSQVKRNIRKREIASSEIKT